MVFVRRCDECDEFFDEESPKKPINGFLRSMECPIKRQILIGMCF